MKEMQQNSKGYRIEYIQGKTQTPPSNQAIGMANTKFPLQRSKTSRIKGFGENISQLPLYINVFHHYVSFLNMVSQEVISHFYVFCSPWETRFWARHMALELSHIRGTLLYVTP
jgi:hypothetical protein